MTPTTDDKWEPAGGNTSSTNFPGRKRRATTSLCWKSWAFSAEACDARKRGSWNCRDGASTPHVLRTNRNDRQSGGHGDRRFRSAIGRGLGCASGDEQDVPIDQSHVRRLGIKYLFEVDGNFLNSGRRLA